MPALQHVFVLLALIALVLAVPAPNANIKRSPIVKRSFKVERVVNPNFKRAVGHKRAVGAGTRALVKAHRKYSIPLPAGLLEAMGRGSSSSANADAPNVNSIQSVQDFGESIQALGDLLAGATKGQNGQDGQDGQAGQSGQNATKGQNGSAASTGAAGAKTTATPGASNGGAGANSGAPFANSTASNSSGIVSATPVDGDVEYLSPVDIGGQTLNLDFDSGSSDLWVFSSQLSAASQTGHTVYDPSKSSTFQMISGATYTISYGDGSGSAGNVGTDVVNIGGVAVQNQAVELATAVSQSFVQDTDSNGLLGLAFSKLNTVQPQQQKTFFDNAIPQLKAPVFTADLRAGAPGSYEFGNIDSTKFNGTMQWANINNTRGFWQFSTNSFVVGTGDAMLTPGAQAIADTGTTLMLTSATIVDAYYSTVNGAVNDAQVGGVVFPCNSQLPDLQVDVGNSFMATVRGSDINFAPVDQAGTTCFGGVQAIDSNLQIYGDIMFKSQFVAFNAGNNSIGMAPHQ